MLLKFDNSQTDFPKTLICSASCLQAEPIGDDQGEEVGKEGCSCQAAKGLD
jgi:hypothetical protein